MADDPAGTEGAGTEGGGSEAPGSEAERLAKVEKDVSEVKGTLGQIKDMLSGTGKAGPAHTAAETHTQDRLDASSSIAEQVRKAVQDVDAERAQREADAAHSAEHAALKQARETPPRESQAGARGKLQRIMFGGEPK